MFSDRDIDSQKARIEAALDEADVFFGSLLFDYDQAGLAVSVFPDDPSRLRISSLYIFQS